MDQFDVFDFLPPCCLSNPKLCEALCILHEFDLLEAAYLRRLYRYKAHYSLDRGEGIEKAIQRHTPDPAEEYERREADAELYAAIASLPRKQAKRIYAHFFIGMSRAEIARLEKVDRRSVSESIERGLKNLKTALQKKL